MPKSPWIVDITPLKRVPGVQRPFVQRCDLAERPESVDAMQLSSAGVVANEVRLELKLEVAGEELVVTGSVAAEWTGPCRRCLEPQAGETLIDIREIFEKRPVEGETYRLDENEVDLELMVREAVLLHLPVAPLCGEDCLGPDPDRFPATVAADPDPTELSSAPAGDPRWGALDALKFEDPSS